MDAEKAILLEAWKICAEGKHKSAAQYQQAYDYIEQFKQTSPHILELGFEFAYGVDTTFELGHFGLQLIGDLIKFKWKDLSQQAKLDVKNKLLYLITNLTKSKQINSTQVEYPLYFKNNLCLTFLELIKREWPQNWPSLLQELDEIAKKSVEQKILVFIIYKFLVEEFITNENPNLPAQRRKDIIQYLNANMDYVFGFFLTNLEHSFTALKSENNPDSIKSHINILSACLNCLTNYVDWININFIFSRNYSLINIIFSLLFYKELCVDAAKCFISILNRKGALAERKPLMSIFNDELLNQIYACIKTSLTDANFKHLLKHLVQVLIQIGTQLNSFWSDAEFKSPFDLNCYLNAIFELIISENRLFSYEAVQLWINFMSNQYLQTNSTIVQATLNLAQVMTNSKLLFKVNPDDYLDEFNSEEDFRKFSQKYRSDLAKLIKLSSSLYLSTFLSASHDWAHKIICETMRLDASDQSGYDSSSFLYLCWDAVLFLWTSLMQTVNKKIRDKAYSNEAEFNFIKEKLVSLIESCVKLNSPNANYASFNYSLQSTILISCELDQTEFILETLLRKLYSDFAMFQNKYAELDALKSDAQVLKCIQNLRKQIAANILNIFRSYAARLKKSFDDVYNKSLAIINNSNSTQIERLIFIQSLIFCNNENESSQTQSAFIDQFLRPIHEFFTAQEFQRSVQNADLFVQFIGLNDTDLNAASLQNRRQIFFYLNVLFAVLKSVKSMDDPDVTHFAFASYICVLEPLLQFIKCLNMMHSSEMKTKLKSEYLEMTDAAKTLVIGAQTLTSQIFSSTSINLANESSYYTDRILMFFFNSYEDLHQLIGLYFVKFRKELLMQANTNSDLVRKFGEALFSNFYDLPDFRTRFLVKYVLRALLQFNFERKHIDSNLVIVGLNETFLEYFLPSILAKIDSRMKYFKSTKEKHEDLVKYEQIEQQIIEENQFILLCRDVVDLIRLFFNFDNVSYSKQSHHAPDDFNTIEDDHENLVENETAQEKTETIKISELAAHLLKKNKTIYQSIVLILFEGLTLPDSSCCLKLTQIAFNLFKVVSVTNQVMISDSQQLVFTLNETISEQIFKSCLMALQIHGEHHEISSLLLNLSYLLYEKFPCQHVFNLVLQKIPNLNRNLYDELIMTNDKINMQKNMKYNDKHRKEIYKKIIQPIIGKNVSQLYKNDIEIRILQPLNLKLNSKLIENNMATQEINICSLFDPNQTI